MEMLRKSEIFDCDLIGPRKFRFLVSSKNSSGEIWAFISSLEIPENVSPFLGKIGGAPMVTIFPALESREKYYRKNTNSGQK